MAKRRYPIGEPEVTLTYRTNSYPLSSAESEQLFAEIEATINEVIDTTHCSLQNVMGEVRIAHLCIDDASMVELLLNDRQVLNGKCTLRKQE